MRKSILCFVICDSIKLDTALLEIDNKSQDEVHQTILKLWIVVEDIYGNYENQRTQ